MITAQQILTKIHEAVIRIDLSQDSKAIKLLDKIWNDCHDKNYNAEDLAFLFNRYLSGFLIVFVPTKHNWERTKIDTTSAVRFSRGLMAIAFYYGKRFPEILLDRESWEEFKWVFKTSLEHEMIHINQMVRDKSDLDRERPKFDKTDFTKDDEVRNYLSSKNEIMAYASTIIRNFEQEGFTKEQILRFIRSGNLPHNLKDISPPLEKYLSLFPKNDPVLKRLFLYIYQYSQEE